MSVKSQHNQELSVRFLLLDFCAKHPNVSTNYSRLARRFGVTDIAVRKNMLELVEWGFVNETYRNQHNKSYTLTELGANELNFMREDFEGNE